MLTDLKKNHHRTQ